MNNKYNKVNWLQKISIAYVKELWNCNGEKAFSGSSGSTTSIIKGGWDKDYYHEHSQLCMCGRSSIIARIGSNHCSHHPHNHSRQIAGNHRAYLAIKRFLPWHWQYLVSSPRFPSWWRSMPWPPRSEQDEDGSLVDEFPLQIPSGGEVSTISSLSGCRLSDPIAWGETIWGDGQDGIYTAATIRPDQFDPAV